MYSGLLTVTVYCLSLSLLSLVLWRNLRRHLPAFTLFVVSFVTRDVVILFICNRPFAHTYTWYYIFWTSEFIISAMYLFVIAAVTSLCVRDYPSIWRSSSKLLPIVGLLRIAWTVYSAMCFWGHPNRFVLVGD